MSRNPTPSATVSALPASARRDVTAAPEVVVRRDLGPWCAAWDGLVLVADPPTPFQRSWWLHHVAEGEPCFVLIVAGERLLGGMALQRDRVLGVNRWRSLGGGRLVPYHLQVVVAEGARPEVEARLRDWCRRQGPAIFDLEGLTPDGGFHRVLPGKVRTVGDEPSPYLTLTTADEVVARLPGSLRSTVRRARNELTAAGVTHRLVPPDELDGALDRLYELHQRRRADGSGFLGGFERFAAAARAGSAAGEVVFHELRRGDEVLAVQVDLRSVDRVSCFQAGCDTDADLPLLSTVLLATAIEHACREGASEYDLLRGRQPYEQGWATGERPVVRLRSIVGVSARTALGLTIGRKRVGALKGRLRRTLHRSLQRRLDGRRSDARAAQLAMRRPGVEIPSRHGTVQVLNDPDDLERSRVEWKRLEADVPGPSSQLDWVLAYVRAGAEPDRLRALIIRHEGRLTAVAPLERRGRIVPRLKLIILSASGLRYRDEPQLARLVDALLGLRVPLSLDLLPVGSPGERLLRERCRRTRVVSSSERMGGPSLQLDETWHQPLDHLSSGSRKSLRRRRRQAEALGVLRFEHLAPGRDLAQLRERFDEFVELEASGWKGRAGTAMATDTYRREMMWQHMCAPDACEQIRVGRMTIDGRLVAGYIGWRIGDRYWAAKAAYDEAYAHLSPGQLVTAHEIESAAREGATRYDMTGKHEPYKASWGDGQPLRTIAMYPPSAAGAAAVVVDGTRRLRRHGSARVQRRRSQAQAGSSA